ncbi:MAG: hypothetical protein ACJ0KD_01030 [Dehalococcoidia bacterium]
MTFDLPITTGYEPAIIEKRIREYESFGNHRTGWPADDQTSKWLIEQLKEFGISAETENFRFPRVEYRDSSLNLPGNEKIKGTPLYDGDFTIPEGIEAEMCEITDPELFGKFVIVNARKLAHEDFPNYVDALHKKGALAIILVNGDRDRNIVLQNAMHIDKPFPLPILQVASSDNKHLKSTMMMGGESHLILDGERLQSTATNVIASIEGSQSNTPAIGIVTPKSGWFTCAAERGGGIAIFLALAESIAALPEPHPTVHLLASSGHELNFYGIRSYARTHRDNITKAAAWLHLGASIGAREEPNSIAATSDEDLEKFVRQSLSTSNLELTNIRNPGPAVGGEALILSDLDTRYISFLGGHAYFHSPTDTVDNAFDSTKVSEWALAIKSITSNLLSI